MRRFLHGYFVVSSCGPYSIGAGLALIGATRPVFRWISLAFGDAGIIAQYDTKLLCVQIHLKLDKQISGGSRHRH